MIKNILIVEDHHLVRSGLRLMLENQTVFQTEITEASNGVEALDLLQKKSFDIVVLDISMPLIDGVEVLKKIKKHFKNLPVLMLTMHNEEKLIKKVIKIGASGYLLKSSATNDLIQAILEISKGNNFFTDDILTILARENEKEDRGRARKKKVEDLISEREIEILRLIVKEKTNKQIAEELSLSSRTIEGHRINIMEKLNIKTTIGLVKYAIKSKI